MTEGKKYWLMKSEPTSYSIDHLARDKKTFWSGVRNFQARNFMRDQMKAGDLAFFYHSNAEPSSVAGIMEICKAGYPDFTAWDSKDHHYDPRSHPSKPLWFMVDVRFKEKFKNFIPLESIKKHPKLEGVMVARRGSRLSIQPVSKEHFEIICKMGKKDKA